MIKRPVIDRTSCRREVHLDIWGAGLHTARCGFKTMRALTVTSSPERVETMVRAVHELTGGSGLFRFVDLKTVRATNPLDSSG
jgi:hypothetical protein